MLDWMLSCKDLGEGSKCIGSLRAAQSGSGTLLSHSVVLNFPEFEFRTGTTSCKLLTQLLCWYQDTGLITLSSV